MSLPEGRTDEGRNRVKSLDDKVDIQEEKAIGEKVKVHQGVDSNFSSDPESLSSL